MKSLRERFEEKYIPEPNSGCWIWIAYLDGSEIALFVYVDEVRLTGRQVAFPHLPDKFIVAEIHVVDVNVTV
jgi:hypothetical protein